MNLYEGYEDVMKRRKRFERKIGRDSVKLEVNFDEKLGEEATKSTTVCSVPDRFSFQSSSTQVMAIDFRSISKGLFI
jgi:hypothetical protein